MHQSIKIGAGVSPQYGPPPPFEAEWVGASREQKKDLAKIQRVGNYYHSADFEFEEDSHGRLDYIGVELDFIERLIQKEIAAFKVGDADEAQNAFALQRNFLLDHVGKWAPEFVKTALEFATSDFYRGHLTILNGFIMAERHLFAEVAD